MSPKIQAFYSICFFLVLNVSLLSFTINLNVLFILFEELTNKKLHSNDMDKSILYSKKYTNLLTFAG